MTAACQSGVEDENNEIQTTQHKITFASSFFSPSLFSRMITFVTLILVSFLVHRCWKHFKTQFAFLQRIKAYQALTPFTNTPQVRDPVWISLQQGTIPEWLNGVMYRIGKVLTLKNDLVSYISLLG